MEIRKIEKKIPKIALLVDAWFPLYGGGQVHVAELARILTSEHRYEVDILTRPIKGKGSAYEKDLASIPGLKVKYFGMKSSFGNPFMRIFYLVAVFLHLLFVGRRYAAIHAHAASCTIPMKAAYWWNRVPTLVTVHGSTLFKRGFSVKKFLEKVLYCETKYTQVVSVSENFLKAANVNQHVAVIPNGIDLQRFENVEAEKNEETFDVLFVGRLDKIKGLDVLLKSFKKLLDSDTFLETPKHILLHIVGTGAEEKRLKSLAEKLGVTNKVRFHGKVTGDALVKMYKSSDLFVLPSRSEGFPLSLLEASAAKLPILATDVGDNRKLVLEKVNGHLVSPDDVDELAYYLEQFIQNPHLKQMGEHGYELVATTFTWQHVAEKMARVYERVIQMETPDPGKMYHRFFSILKDKRMPWRLPELFFEIKRSDVSYSGKSPLKFCLTVDVEQSYGSADYPHEGEHVVSFMERYMDMCGSLEIPSTLFVQGDLLEPYSEYFHRAQKQGHELGIHGLHHELWGTPKWFLKDPWQPIPQRKKNLRTIKEILDAEGFENVRAFRAPNLVIDADSLQLIKEAGYEIDSSGAAMLGRKSVPSIKNGLCRVPVSRDPKPSLQYRMGVPFGSYKMMNLSNFLTWSDDELLAAVNRLREFHRRQKVPPHLVFLCHSWEFESRDYSDYSSGENFTQLAKHLAFLKDHMELEFKTLTDLCTDLYATP